MYIESFRDWARAVAGANAFISRRIVAARRVTGLFVAPQLADMFGIWYWCWWPYVTYSWYMWLACYESRVVLPRWPPPPGGAVPPPQGGRISSCLYITGIGILMCLCQWYMDWVERVVAHIMDVSQRGATGWTCWQPGGTYVAGIIKL